MTRLMYDSITPGNIPSSATMVAGYADGLYSNLGAMRARFPHATIVSIAVRWTTRAQVLDVETGDATPAQAVQWCTQTMADKSNHELSVYCNTDTWPSVREAFKAAGVTEPNYWVARYDGDPTIPAGAVAKQHIGDTHGYDVSSVSAYWPGIDPKPGGAEIYPGANTSHWYNSGSNAGDPMQVNTVVWHSTETLALPDYSGGSIAPTLTAVPNWAAKRLDWWQHFPFDTSARALVHDKTQIGTNTLNVAQVEIVGTCDPTTHATWSKAGTPHLYMPELPDWAVRDLAAFAKWSHDAHNVPLTSGLTWKPYPQSYGANGVRMTTAQWSAFNGHCGHQHVPQNDHGDPGQFPIAQVLNPPTPTPAPVQEDDVPCFTLAEGGTTFPRGKFTNVALFCDDTLADPKSVGVKVRLVVWASGKAPDIHELTVSNKGANQTVVQFADPSLTNSVTVTRVDTSTCPVFGEVS
jgi:hypothetical protein